MGLAVVLGLLGVMATAAAARQTMTFIPGDKTRIAPPAPPRPKPTRVYAAPRAGRGTVRPRSFAGSAAPADANAAKATPGPGFTLEDGVLTYPAPARFQPKNLKRF